MSGGLEAFALKKDDVIKFLTYAAHLGTQNVNFQMEQYVYKRRPDGICIFNLRKTWEKLLLAARAIVAIKNRADVCVISARPYGQRAVLKFANATGATPIPGRFVPGTFTNQMQASFREPRLLVITDPITDHQPVTEASYVNIPVIALCNTDSPLRYVDIAIPCNNKGRRSIGLMWWLLAREVLRLRGAFSREHIWRGKVEWYIYGGPEEEEKVAIADNVVVKTGKLTPGDVQRMQTADPDIDADTDLADVTINIGGNFTMASATGGIQPTENSHVRKILKTDADLTDLYKNVGGKFIMASANGDIQQTEHESATDDWSKQMPPLQTPTIVSDILSPQTFQWGVDNKANWTK